MALLTSTSIAVGGTVVSGSSAAGGGDTFVYAPNQFLIVKNADAGSHTVTIASQRSKDGLALPNRAVAVANGVTKAIPIKKYMADADGIVHVTYDGVTSVTVQVLRCP